MSIYNFSDRHIGPRNEELNEMLEVVEASSIRQLVEETIPHKIHLKNEFAICFF